MLIPLALLLIALLAFANGSNDVSKSVATLVGSGVTDYRRALLWGTVWTTVGVLLASYLGAGVALRFVRSLGAEAGRNAAIPLAMIVASLAWVAFSSFTGLPVSTTHAITGAILGVGWVAEGLSPLARMDLLKGFAVPLLASPVMAVGLSFVIGPTVARVGRWLEGRCVCVVPNDVGWVRVGPDATVVASPTFGVVVDRAAQCEGRSVWAWNLSPDRLHWLSSALVALSRGVNDAPKIWALVFPLFFIESMRGPLPVAMAVAFVTYGMGLGSWVAGRRVTTVLAERVTRMDHHEGLAANLATAALVLGASRLGLPVSTTHVSSGAIVGIGLGQGRRGVDWRVFAHMALAWVVTLPVAAIVAMGVYTVLKLTVGS